MIKIQTQNDLTMTNIKNFDYIIVGAGISGMSAAETISLALPDSTILIINNFKLSIKVLFYFNHITTTSSIGIILIWFSCY